MKKNFLIWLYKIAFIFIHPKLFFKYDNKIKNTLFKQVLNHNIFNSPNVKFKNITRIYVYERHINIIFKIPYIIQGVPVKNLRYSFKRYFCNHTMLFDFNRQNLYLEHDMTIDKKMIFDIFKYIFWCLNNYKLHLPVITYCLENFNFEIYDEKNKSIFVPRAIKIHKGETDTNYDIDIT